MLEKLRDALKNFTEKITKKTLTEKRLKDALWDLKLALLSSDVALPVAEKIAEDVKKSLLGQKIGLIENTKKIVANAIKNAIIGILTSKEEIDLFKIVEEKRKQKEPTVIIFVGFNGTGKTTTIAKLAYLLKKKGYSVVLAASDTFRAGSIEQLEEHAKRLGVKVIKHKYGSDAAAVAFDAINHAKAKGIDVVLIDTAGRAQTDKNLMDEMRKIVRVTEPDLVIFVGDALAGNDALVQAEKFNEAVEISGSILTKVDADVKGGAALSISYITGKPILFIGVGQKYEDLKPFDPKWFTEKITKFN